MSAKIDIYIQQLKDSDSENCIEFFTKLHPGKVAFATSLGAEDQILTDMIMKIDKSVHFFTLDTGRLFQESYDLLDITEKKYGCKIRIFFPEALNVEEMVQEKGINLFYESVENRKLCCHIRKIESLSRALSEMSVWITGLRKDQSITRQKFEMIEWDETFNVIKVNPLINWSNDQVWDYIKEHKLPYNELHDKGYPSIGCQPCTRAIQPGADIRDGRWWWELPENKERGLHQK